MAASFLFSQFMGGLTTAMFLFLIASGLSLVFGIMRVINFAHGSFYMLGAYLAWQGVQWLHPTGAGFWLATLFAAVTVGVPALRLRVRAGEADESKRQNENAANTHDGCRSPT